MTEKKYRITYNPYKRTTKVEEYYPGASNPWTSLGSEKEPELNHILAEKESIQQICMDLLSWIEEHNNQYSNCKEYEVIFYGIEQDFNEIKTIGEAFKNQHAGCRFMGIIQPEKFWDEPSKIQTNIEKICENIRTIYVDENELLEKIEACLDVIDQNLNILVLGIQNSGKSTLINALLGREILPTSEGIETAALYTIESGNADQILIYLSSGKCMEISIENDRIKYTAIGCEVDQIVGNISESKGIKKAKCSSEIIQAILKELNTVCLKEQNFKKELFIKEIKVQLKDFEILGKKQTVCIKDFPGAGAKYLGEEHKAIIQKEIENITNAVAINVLNADNSTLKTVYDFIGNVRDIDNKKQSDIGSQIDFARSIYVLNKAEGVTDWKAKKDSVKKDFLNKKVVFCCAEAAVQMTTRRKVASKYKPLFVQVDEDELLDLQSKAMLPVEYTPENVQSLTQDMISSLEYGEALKNTGIILCAGLIKEYADNFAAVNRTRCYYQAVRKMMEQLKQEEIRQEEEKEAKKKEKEQEQEEVRNSLKGQCEVIVTDCKNNIKKVELNKKLRESIKRYLETTCDCVNGLKKIKKEYKKLNKEIEKANKKKQKESRTSIPDETKNWHIDMENRINETIQNKHDEIKEEANKLLSIYCEQAKQQLLDKISATELTLEEETQIKSIISEYSAHTINENNYKMPKRFVLSSFSPNEIGKWIFNHSEWQEDQIMKSIRGYWSKFIIEPYSEQLESDIKMTLDELLKHMLTRLDTFAPALISLQKEIDNKEARLSELREKISQSNKQCELCECIVERGRVS